MALGSKWASLKWHCEVASNKIRDKFTRKRNTVAIFDPSIHTKNMGDEIIRYYGTRAIEQIFPSGDFMRIATQVVPEDDALRQVMRCKHRIVCGTNLMSPDYEGRPAWHMHRTLFGYSDICTLGVGWTYYKERITRLSQLMYTNALSKKLLHSVRDRYTEQKFHQMGIHNVIFTGCVTLWELTPEKCAKIPTKKADRVIATITDYDRDQEADSRMLQILLENYEKVYVWLQGDEDLPYVSSIVDTDRIEFVESSLEAFENILNQGNIDYVGTRLHGGIFAMNHGVRSIILSIDCRAAEMGKDVNLVVVPRDRTGEKLEQLIKSEFETKLTIPWDNIEKWSRQFRKCV